MKLKDIAKVQGGFAFKSDSFISRETPIIRIGNIVNNRIEIDDDITAPIETIGNRKEFLVNKNDILIAMSGATVGKVGIYNYDFPSMLNQRVGNIKAEGIYQKYIYYLLQSPLFKKYIELSSIGCAQPNISGAQIENFEFKENNIEEIEKIVKQLDNINSLIKLREEEIRKCELLIKSQFVEMFGDPILNEKNWNKEKNKELCSKIGSGATPKGGNSVYLNEGITFIRSMNVYDNAFEYKDLAFLDDRLANELKNVVVEKNDILLNITGASVCRCCIVPNDLIPARVNQHVSILRYKTCNPVFILHQFINDSFKDTLYKISKSGGATREALTKTQLEDLELIYPPIELQNKFAKIVEQIDKQKFEFEKSLKKLEELQSSLMQEYFG